MPSGEYGDQLVVLREGLSLKVAYEPPRGSLGPPGPVIGLGRLSTASSITADRLVAFGPDRGDNGLDLPGGQRRGCVAVLLRLRRHRVVL
jgi:hypothetical protein